MRTVSGRRNRIALLAAGLLLVVAAVWTAAAASPLLDRWPQAAPFLPGRDVPLAEVAAAASPWLVPTGLALAVLVVIAGIGLLLAQVPSAPSRGVLRVTDPGEHLLGSLPPEVLDRALGDRLEQIQGVGDADVHVGGTVSTPWVQASITVEQGAELAWVVEAARRSLSDTLATVLGAAPRNVDLVVRLRTGSPMPPLRREVTIASAPAGR